MSLRARTAAFLIGISLILLAATYAVQELVVMPTFMELERTGAERNVSRCLEAIDVELESLAGTVHDWASWDDTYAFIEDRNPHYVENNLGPESFHNASLNLVCMVDCQNRIVWGKVRRASGEEASTPELFAAIEDPLSPIPRHARLDDAMTGVFVTRQGPLLLASRPILTTKGQGPIRGSLIMGRFLHQSEINDLAQRMHVKLQMWVVGQAALPPAGQRLVALHGVLPTSLIEQVDENLLHGYAVYPDVYGQPAMLLQIEVPRDVTSLGRVASRVASACSLAGGVATLAAVWVLLQREVVSPLRLMASHMRRVSEANDLTGRLQLARRDEIGALANAFNRMVQALAESQQALSAQNTALLQMNEQLSSEMRARQIADEKTRHIAFHDTLTGLPNRAFLMNRLHECLARRDRCEEHQFAVLFIDVDNFKLVNDTLGHRAGDRLLQHLASAMVAVLRSSRSPSTSAGDVVARLGGDEFVVLLEGVRDMTQAVAVAERIQREASRPCELGQRLFNPSISVGLAIGDRDVADAADIVRDADTALYHAKALGKGRIALFDQPMRTRVLERAHLESDLHEAIRARQFQVFYQPIISLATGGIHCLEALVRWRHPERGLLPPDTFLPIAEQAGLMEAIGQQVIEEVIQQTAAWRAQPWKSARDLAVSINLSAGQLIEAPLLEHIDACLEKYQLAAGAIKVELTESTAMRDLALTRRVIEALQARGIEAYLDDFGTGYSSLSTLHTLPFAAIKLDKSFMEDVATEAESQMTVRAIAMIAENRRMRLVAEGVETLAQVSTLRELDCRFVQGFYFSRPLPAAEITALLRAETSYFVAPEPQLV